jgi:hypothetical protein
MIALHFLHQSHGKTAVLEVLQESDDFTEIGDLLKRHDTLKVRLCARS